MYDGAILPQSHYIYIWYTSWISLGSAVYSLYRQYYDVAACIFMVFLTSLLYWRFPDYSWRRYLDISAVHVALIYEVIRVIDSTHMVSYYVIISVGIWSFFTGVHFHKKSAWLSTFFHCNVHLLGNTANFVLLSGTLKPFREWLH
jgi:hypothetical protein